MEVKKILLIIDFSQNSIYMQSVAYAFKKNGYHVEFLFFCEPGELSNTLKKNEITCHFNPLNGNLIARTIKGIIALHKIQHKNKFDHIFSHLTLPNLIASFFQLISVKPKITVCRHHSDMYYQEKVKNGIRLDKITQALAKNIVVISEKSKEVIIQLDKCNPKKITYLPLLYDFSLYGNFEDKRESTTLIQLVFVSRLVELKKIQAIFPILEKIKKSNCGISPFNITIIGEGAYKERLIQMSIEHGIQNEVNFKGFLNNPLDEVNSSDILVLLSSSESSNQVVKEAGILGKTVIACKNVGDFDSYLTEENAFLLNKEFTFEELEQLLNHVVAEKNKLLNKGELLKKKIQEQFSINLHFYKYLCYFN